MTWQLNSLVLIFLLATALTSGVFFYTIQHRQVQGASYFTLLVASVATWLFFNTLEFAVVEPDWKILFAKFEYLGIATIGLTWYLFSLNYSQKENPLGKNYWLLLILPVLTVIAAFTNQSHHLLWPEITVIPGAAGPNLAFGHGPAFWIIFVYNYILLAFGTVIIVRTVISSHEIYRWQMIGLIVSASLPWLGNLIYVLGLSPMPGLDLTPLGFALGALVTAWSIFFLRLFDLAPVARDQLVENLVDGVIVLDRHHRLIDINLKARELLGISNERAIGRKIVDFLQARPELIERFKDVQHGQAEIHLGPSTAISDIDVRVSPLLDARKNAVGRIFTIRDISGQKKTENMRESLTHAVVHDLRNPLTTVALGLEMLRRQAMLILPKEQNEMIDISRQSVQRMLELVDSILDVNRLESGEMPVRRKKSSLYTIASEAVRSIALLANQKRILLQVDIPRDLPEVSVDANLMRRVIQNLLDNSVKYSIEGGIIRIHAGFDKKENAMLVSVVDTGSGIEDAVRENIFEKFVSGRERTNGSGLGLAFCRLAVEAHGGRIWVDGTHQGGTKISLTIPDESLINRNFGV